MSIAEDTGGEGGQGGSSGIWIQGGTLWSEDWDLEITVFHKNSKENGWLNKFHDTAQRFAAILEVEVDSKEQSQFCEVAIKTTDIPCLDGILLLFWLPTIAMNLL